MKRLFCVLLALVLLTGCGKKETAPVLPVTDSQQAYTAKFTPDPAPEPDELIRDQWEDWTLRLDDQKEFLFLDTPDGTVWETKLRWTGNDRVYVIGDTVYLHLGRELYTVTADGSRQLDQKTRWIAAAPDGDRLLAIGMPPTSETTSYQLYAITGTDIACLGTLDVEGMPRYLTKGLLVTDQAVYSPQDTGLTKLSSLVALGIDPSSLIGLRSDGEFPALVAKEGYYLLTPAEDAVPKEQIEVYALGDYSRLISGLISRFNAQSEDYIANLTVFASEDELSLPLLTGNIPDAIMGDSGVVSGYLQVAQNQGMLRSITDLVESMVTEDTYFTNILDEYRIDGDLYGIPLNYMLQMFSFPVSLLGDRTKLETLEELDTVLRAAGQETYENEFKVSCFTQDIVLGHLTWDCITRWVDFDTKTASFDDPSFGEILQYCKRYNRPGEPAPDIDTDPIYTYAWIMTTEYVDPPANLLTDYRYVPPFLSPYDGAAIDAKCMIAMSKLEPYSEGAEALIRFCLSQEAQEYLVQYGGNWKLPVLRTAIHENPKADPAMRQHILSLIEQADHCLAYNSAITSILHEEAEYYFAGDRSLEDTQAMIQDRVSLYLAELK